MKSKRTQQLRNHFDKRAAERLGCIIPSASQKEIVQLIQQGKAQFLKRNSNSRTVWSVDILGQPHTVVYDKRRKVLVTIWKRGTDNDSQL